tara:strand:+ start:1494 stop:2126 length:633 start_codon:yes stop_codon:yes gene_type:complete
MEELDFKSLDASIEILEAIKESRDEFHDKNDAIIAEKKAEAVEEVRAVTDPTLAAVGTKLATRSNPLTAGAALATDAYRQGKDTETVKNLEQIQKSQQGSGNIVLNDVGIPITLPVGDFARSFNKNVAQVVTGLPKASENLVVGMADLLSPAQLADKIKFRNYPDVNKPELFNPNTGMPKATKIPRITGIRAAEPRNSLNIGAMLEAGLR